MRAEAANLSRPDRSHVVLDMMPDVIHVTDEDKGYDFDMEVIQVWVDPAHKDAWRHPSLLDYFWHACERKKKEGRRLALLIRYSADEGFAVFPPATADGQWTIHQTDGDWTERPTGETMERLMNL
jgi:hypothetical protein